MKFEVIKKTTTEHVIPVDAESYEEAVMIAASNSNRELEQLYKTEYEAYHVEG